MYCVQGCTALCTCTMMDAVRQVANGPWVISAATPCALASITVGCTRATFTLSTDLYCIHVFWVAGNFGEVYNPRTYAPEGLRYSFSLSICPSVHLSVWLLSWNLLLTSFICRKQDVIVFFVVFSRFSLCDFCWKCFIRELYKQITVLIRESSRTGSKLGA